VIVNISETEWQAIVRLGPDGVIEVAGLPEPPEPRIWMQLVDAGGAVLQVDVSRSDSLIEARIWAVDDAEAWLSDLYAGELASIAASLSDAYEVDAIEEDAERIIRVRRGAGDASLRRFALGLRLRDEWPIDAEDFIDGRDVSLGVPPLWLLDAELALLAYSLGGTVLDPDDALARSRALLAPHAADLADALEAAVSYAASGTVSEVLRIVRDAAELAEAVDASDSDQAKRCRRARRRYDAFVAERRAEQIPTELPDRDLLLRQLLEASERVPAPHMGGTGARPPRFAPADWDEVHPRQLSAASTAVEWVIDTEDDGSVVHVSVDRATGRGAVTILEDELYARVDAPGVVRVVPLEIDQHRATGSVRLPVGVPEDDIAVSVYSDRFGTGSERSLGDVRALRGEVLRTLTRRIDAAARAVPGDSAWDAPFAYERVIAASDYEF
jgi:hypothetical protein